ncbi:ArsR family transcriptional regulator [Halobacteria archaeon HArc-gm2]|nr:ArsR family transcriptional regulator [Halobacteria archaeon HArc-gm2]
MTTMNTSRLNETFDLLTHPHRRYVLYHLKNKTGDVGIEPLAAAIADSDEVHPGMERATSIDEIKTKLYHTHLPKLAEAGFITVGPTMDSIVLAAPDGLDRFLAESAPIDGYEDTITTAD